MPINDLRDIAYASGNPTNTGKPQQSNASLASWQQGYLDNAATQAAQAVYGQLVRLSINPLNVGGGFFTKSVVAAEAFLNGEAGVVQSAPTGLSPQNQGVNTYRGMAFALCTTGATAIAAGTLLAADGAGNLTVAPTTPTPGQLIARSIGTLAANTATPTLVRVYVGCA